MSIHRRLLMTAVAVLACAAAGGGIAIAQGSTSGHKSRHSIARLRHEKRVAQRVRRGAVGRGERGRRFRHRRHTGAGERRPGDRETGCGAKRGHAFRVCRRAVRAARDCDFDDVPRHLHNDAIMDARQECAESERSGQAAPAAPATTETANFAG